MGVVEAKLSVKSDGPSSSSSPPPPPMATTMNSIDMLNGELASLELEEKPKDGVGDGASGIDEPTVDATNSVDMLNGELMSLELEEKLKDEVSNGALGIDEPAFDATNSVDMLNGELMSLELEEKPKDGVSDGASGIDEPAVVATNSVDMLNGELMSLELEEKPKDGVSDRASGIDEPVVDASPDQDPGSPEKGEEEAEKGVLPPFPHRPDEPDCAFYMKTGTCKFGLNCKFNHPSKKRRHRVRSKKQADDVQFPKAAKDERERSGSKIMGHNTWKVDEKEKKVPKRSFRQENVTQKQKGTPLKWVEQTDKKGLEEKKQTPSKRVEQENHENVVEKPKGTLQKLEKTEKKAVEEEKQTSSKRLEQEDHKVDEKEKEIAHNFIQAESEHIQEKQKGAFLRMMKQTQDKVVKEKQTFPGRMKQEDNKGVKEKQIPSVRMEKQDNKAARKMSKENTSEKVGATQCKFYTMPGGCKFGKSCKYVHPQKKIEVDPVELNFLGLPIRPGEKECPFYMRTGNCKYATNCRYHHPDPTVASIGQDPLPPCQNSQPKQGFGASPLPVAPNPTQGAYHGATPSTFSSPSYSPGSNLHPQGFHSISEYNVYQVHTDEYPDQPGQLECQHFMKNGVCKFGSACKFRHPTVHLPPTEPFGTFNPPHPLQ